MMLLALQQIDKKVIVFSSTWSGQVCRTHSFVLGLTHEHHELMIVENY